MHRVAAIGPTPHADVVQAWVDAGLHADMDWYTRTLDVRLDPRLRDPEARSVLVLAMDHAVTVPPDPGGLTGRVARYAWGRDYHNLIGKRLKGLRRDLREAGVANWGGVDTAPIVERAWAAASGLGYTGRNGVQIVPAHGSWMLLAVLFLDAVLEPDKPLTRDHCGACTRCLPACPTDAFVGPRVLDANRCIAYWTIESQDLPPLDLLDGFGRWVFGCDVCQDVCPHNAAAADGIEADFCFHNCRIVENRLTNTFIALSSQPGLGGPTYFVRNSIYSVILSAFKLQRSSVGDVLWHNSVVKNGDGFGIYTSDVFSRQRIRNNLFLGGPGGTFNGYSSGQGRVIQLSAADASVDMDYDAYGSMAGSFSGEIGSTSFASLAELQSMTSEVHAVEIDASVFATAVPYPATPLTPYPARDLRPAAGSGVVDTGEAIAGLNDEHEGAGPDIGAHEAGRSLPAYGPR